MSDPVSSAVISEFVSRLTSFFTGKCSEYKSTNEYVDRLDMLHIKIKSAVEVSEAFDINIKSLQEWQDKLKGVLCEIDETLIFLREKPNRTVEGGSSSHDQSMQEEGFHGALEFVTNQVELEAILNFAKSFKPQFRHLRILLPLIMNLVSGAIHIVWKPQKNLFGEYLENDKKVNKLKKTVEKLEKMAGDIGDFIELLKLQSKRNMCRKRKRSARPCQSQGFFLVISFKLQTYALFCYGKDYHLLFIKWFPATYLQYTTGITSDVF